MTSISRNRRTLMGLEISEEVITADLRNALAYRSTIRGCSFVNCEIGKADLSASTIEDCEFIDCDLDQAVFRSASIKRTRFLGGRAQYSSFENATLSQVKFDIDLHGADLRYAAAEEVDYSGSNLWGANIRISCSFFKGMKFDDRSLRLFLALLGITKGEPEFVQDVNALSGDQACKMMAKLSEESA